MFIFKLDLVKWLLVALNLDDLMGKKGRVYKKWEAENSKKLVHWLFLRTLAGGLFG